MFVLVMMDNVLWKVNQHTGDTWVFYAESGWKKINEYKPEG